MSPDDVKALSATLELGLTASENGAPASDLYDFTAAALRLADNDAVVEWLAAFVASATADYDEADALPFYRFAATFGQRLRDLGVGAS